MKSNNILLVNPDFDPENCPNYSLSLKIGTNTFSYAIVNKQDKRLLALYDEQECKDLYEQLAQRLKHDAYLQQQFNEVNLYIHPLDQILVPKPIFEISAIENFTKYFDYKDHSQLYVNSLFDDNMKQVMGIDKRIDQLIDNNWTVNHKANQNSGLINLLCQQEVTVIGLDFTVGTFQLNYIKDKQLIHTQNYEFDNVDELGYYLFLTVQTLDIETNNIQLYLSGIIHQDDDKWNFLAQYFKNIKLLFVKTNYQTDILEDMPQQYYTALLSLI